MNTFKCSCGCVWFAELKELDGLEFKDGKEVREVEDEEY